MNSELCMVHLNNARFFLDRSKAMLKKGKKQETRDFIYMVEQEINKVERYK